MRKHGWFRPHVRGLTAISSTTLREGVAPSFPAVLTLVGDDWYADTDEAATADGYAVSDGSGGYVIDDVASEGLPLFVRSSSVYLEI